MLQTKTSLFVQFPNLYLSTLTTWTQ